MTGTRVEAEGERIQQRTYPAWLAWAVVLLVVGALIGLTHYKSPDDDSFLYAGISARLSQLPVAQWIAPEWWGFWTLHGPYCEHPVGIFILPAALGRLGFPAEQAAYAVNALWQAASFILMALIAGFLVDRREARALGWLLQLIPIAFVFRVRANHEYAVLAGVLFALYSTERARTRPAWTIGMVAGFCGVLLVKGVFAVIVPVTCVCWLLARAGGPSGLKRSWQAWTAIALMPVAGALVAWGYEAAYLHVTGRSFLDVYRARQLPQGAVTGGSPVTRTAYSAVWYTGRIVWYGFPWTVGAGLLAVRGLRKGVVWPWAKPLRPTAVQGAWFAVVAGLALTALFSLAHRKADRYIFPVYFILAAAGAVAGIRRFAWLGRLVERMDRPWLPAAIYLGLFLLRLVTLHKLPEFTFWRS